MTLRSPFVEKAKKKHGDLYDYSDVDYRGSEESVKIICGKHGPFNQTPKKHISGQGCKACGRESASEKQRKCLDDFLNDARKVHGNRYIYDDVVYVDAKTPVSIGCRQHGIFDQIPDNHRAGKGCSTCRNEMLSEARRKSTAEFVDEAVNVHNGKYDYSQVNYLKNNIHVKIGCHIHGYFLQIPFNHLRGIGCRACTKYGFDPTAPAILYFVSVNYKRAEYLRYKIGVTNRTVKERFKGDDARIISPLYELYFEVGADALKCEGQMLEKYSGFLYHGPRLLSSGNTELFEVNVWLLENLCFSYRASGENNKTAIASMFQFRQAQLPAIVAPWERP